MMFMFTFEIAENCTQSVLRHAVFLFHSGMAHTPGGLRPAEKCTVWSLGFEVSPAVWKQLLAPQQRAGRCQVTGNRCFLWERATAPILL